MPALPDWALNWKTDAMVAAERNLDEVASRAEAAMAEADRKLFEVESKEKPPSPVEIAMVKQYATGPQSPPEWKEPAAKVAKGDFSWADYLSGKVDNDPAVAAALNATIRQAEEKAAQPPEQGPAVEEGAVEQSAPPAGTSEPRRTPRRRDRSPADEFDDFSHTDWLR